MGKDSTTLAPPQPTAGAATGSLPEGHGAVGVREQQFTSILPTDHPAYDPKALAKLADLTKGEPDVVKDGDDPEENIWVPAGYTYFGQFVDHDLTFDSTSSLNPDDMNESNKDRMPTNLRTPRFDLDCIYGDGPDAQPFMYAGDGATLLIGGHGRDINGVQTADFELLRSTNGKAIIGDKRNDENSIVNQIQQGFIKAHNKVVDILSQQDPDKWTAPNDLFKSARNEIRWTYQTLLMKDFLPRIIASEVMTDLQGKTVEQRKGAYALYTDKIRSNLPREFVVAAYRFGHSGVRTGYRLNRRTRLSIFPGSEDDPSGESLIGFDPLPKSHVIDDWGRFFPTTPPGTFPGKRKKVLDTLIRPEVRLQYAYKIDTTIVDPLGVLPVGVAGLGTTKQAKAAVGSLPGGFRPSLALLNLLRGNTYKIRNGQAMATKLAEKFPKVTPLEAKHLVVRVPSSEPKTDFKFVPIDAALQKDTPLWFYILAEAQAPVVDFVAAKVGPGKAFSENLLVNDQGAKTQLGWVGGRIVAEVFYGLLDSDDDSVVHAKTWTPIIGANTLRDFLDFAREPLVD